MGRILPESRSVRIVNPSGTFGDAVMEETRTPEAEAPAPPVAADQQRTDQPAGQPDQSLEGALALTEAAVDDALGAAAELTGALRRLRAAAQNGNLRDLRAALARVEQAGEHADDEAERAAASWTFDEDAYFASGRFTAELLDAAREDGLQLFERDERLYCYPVLVRVAPAERAVFVDRTRERRVRPSVLVRHLRAVQRRPPRFRPEAFLEALFAAYGHIVRRRGPDQLDAGHSERLLEVYELLTLMPGVARDYSRQEFARDVYLLDRSGVTATRRGYALSFPASSGARSAGSALRVVTEGGQEKVYYGIAFAPPG
jgi:hypothetical protein